MSTVPAGESVTTRVEVPAAACSIVDAAGRRVVEPGEFELRVGPSSRESDLLACDLHHHAEGRCLTKVGA